MLGLPIVRNPEMFFASKILFSPPAYLILGIPIVDNPEMFFDN
jgi:hypothetical protein